MKTFLKYVGVIILYVILGAALWAFTSWGIILFVGNLHHWWSFIPVMGFWTAVWVEVPLGFIVTGFVTSQRIAAQGGKS